ncbi:MAG TPA: BamA/TamA family outer membrane protein [Steroidobacteraceae bacterium]|nr:BamA/TamA family outer membrane protein [Steroidobacteraceae bacterium]
MGAPLLAACLIAGPLAQAAGVRVEIKGVDEELRANVLAYLSIERYRKGGAELNADIVERLHNRVEREVQAALKPFGYYEPQVDSTVTDLGHSDWRVNINISPGPPVLLEHVDVRIDGPGGSDPVFQRILRRMPLHEGGRLKHADYEDVKTGLQRAAATYGYLDARLIRNELVVDPPNHHANVALELETGERYRFGATTIHQNVVDESLVRRYLRYHEGEPFDLTQVLRTQFALDDAQYFSNLEVLPAEPDRTTRIVPVNIHADASRRHHYSFGPGYATDTGARGTLGFEDRRINTHGHSFSLEVQAAQVTRYSLQSRYNVPIGDPAVEKLTLAGTVEQRQLADVTARTLSAGPSITEVTGNWQHVWLLTAMRTNSEDANGAITNRMLVPGLDLASVPKGYLGEPLFEHPFFAEVRGSHAALGSDSNFLQLHLQAERVFRLGRKWHLLLRDEVGASLVSHFAQLPAVFRFFAGGDNSVRGFAYNDLSPLEAVCDITLPGKFRYNKDGTCGKVSSFIKAGGKDEITGTVEVIRDLPNNFGIAAFFDYGNAYNSLAGLTHRCQPLAGDAAQTQECGALQYSVGIGLRVRLPVMTLGVDIAQPLTTSLRWDNVSQVFRSVHPGPRLHINFSPKL